MLAAQYSHLKGYQANCGKVSARRTLAFFFRSTDFKCTHCTSEARLLGLMQRTEDNREVRRLVNVKLVLSLLFKCMRMWISDVHDSKMQKLPRVILKFIPTKTFSDEHVTTERMHRAFAECGDVEWLEGYRHIAVIGIFFVFDDDDANIDDENVQRGDDADAPEYHYDAANVNDVFNRVWKDNFELHSKRCAAKLRSDFKGSQQLSVVEADYHNVLSGNLDGSGYKLDEPNGQDMSEIPKNAEHIFSILQQFNSIKQVPQVMDRAECVQMHRLMGVNHGPDVMRRILRRRGYGDVDWNALVVADVDVRGGHAWNLDGPFVHVMSSENFTSAHFERSVQPRFDERVPTNGVEAVRPAPRVAPRGLPQDVARLERDPAHDFVVPRRRGAFGGPSRDPGAGSDEEQLRRLLTFATGNARDGVEGDRMDVDDDELENPTTDQARVIYDSGIFDPHGLHDAMCRQAATEGERVISGMHVASVVLKEIVDSCRAELAATRATPAQMRRDFESRQDSWLRNWYMCVVTGNLPMSVALKKAIAPFLHMLARDFRRPPGEQRSLNHPRVPYTYGHRLTAGMQYVAMTWEFMDRAVNVQSLHALAMQMHFCLSAVFCQKWQSNNKRLPHMWVCGVHQVGKSYVMEEVSRVTLPDAMRNLVTGQTPGSYFPSNQYTGCDEEHCTYFAELYNEMPPNLVGMKNGDDERVAKLKAALTGDGMSHKRLVPGVDHRGERGGFMPETVKIFPRYLIIALMNQPYHRIPNAVRSRATPHEAMKVPRGKQDTMSDRTRGNYVKHFPQMTFDVCVRARMYALGERLRDPSAAYDGTDAEAQMNVRARHTVLTVLYAIAVRLRVCRGPSMKEVKRRHGSFKRVLDKLGLTLEDPSRRMADVYSMAYAHTMHAAVWRALSSDRSAVPDEATQFTPQFFREVDKCAVCSSSVALYSFSTLVVSLMSKPVRMILFFAGAQCADNGQVLIHPTDMAADDADVDTRYCIVQSTFEARDRTVAPKHAQQAILARFARAVVGYYADPRNSRRHNSDKLESEYVEGILATLLTQQHKDVKSNSLITPMRWVQEESGISLAVSVSHVPENPATATLDDDAFDVRNIMRECVTSNVRCQRLLYNDHARVVAANNDVTHLPQYPKYYDVPQHDAECAIMRVEHETCDDALEQMCRDAKAPVPDPAQLRERLTLSRQAVRDREEAADAQDGMVDPFLMCRTDFGCTCFRSAKLRATHGTDATPEALRDYVFRRDPIPEDVAFDTRMRYYHVPDALADADTRLAYHPTLGATDEATTRDYPARDVRRSASDLHGA
ncbi:hypothetical protein CYMTET_6142 [Cymbomonas tetramitiformis]|uniref:Uncharacterized protein n=1 Tax=Cymbomonas tetramitiformis TaxID=36881 RepID=A0AAE0GZP2_9CHLO|nr:hypothetical protein CYMTET_6142 [Cymbomonas tetramitiformis]